MDSNDKEIAMKRLAWLVTIVGAALAIGFGAGMSAAGKALLINSICYISRFTDDRPIVHTPCVFIQGKRIFDGGAVGRLLAN